MENDDLTTIRELRARVHDLYRAAIAARDLAREAEKEFDQLVFETYREETDGESNARSQTNMG